MSMLDTLRDWFGPLDDPAIMDVAIADRAEPAPMDTRGSLSGMIPGWTSGKPTWPSDNVIVMTRDGYRKCVTAFACINIIADAVAEATLRVWIDEGAGKRDEIVDHPLRQLMQRPNDRMSESELLTDIVRIAAITGYCVVEKIRSARGNPVELGILRPDYVRPILRDQRAPNWEYTVPGESPSILDADDAVVFTYMGSPTLSVTGDTPLRAILREAGILNELTDFLKLLLERGGMPQIALVVDSTGPDDVPNEKLTDDEREAIRQQFIAKYTGYRNWVGPAIIEGMRVEQIGFDLNQIAFKDLRDGLDLSVCRAFRVPPPVVQVMAGLTTSYGQTLEQSMKLLQMYTANPLRSRLDGALTRGLLPEFDARPNIDLEFDTSSVDALQEDEKAVHERARENLRAGGITLDEFRQRVGEKPLENQLGKSLLIAFSMVPTPIDQDVVPPPLSGTPPDNSPDNSPDNDPEDEEDRAYDPDAPLTIPRDGRTYRNQRSISPIEQRRQANIVAKSKQQIVRLAGLIDPDVATFLQEQKGRVIEAVTGQRSISLRAVEEIDWDAEDALLLELFRGWWSTVGETAFTDASAILGVETVWDVSNPQLRNVVDVLGKRIVDISETTRSDMESIITEALLEGVSMPELLGKIEHLFENTYKGRASTIARTESQVAYNLSSQAAYQASGVVAEVQLHDNSQHTDDYGASDGLSCAQRNGLIVPLGDMQRHVYAEHPNGTLAVAAIVRPLEDA